MDGWYVGIPLIRVASYFGPSPLQQACSSISFVRQQIWWHRPDSNFLSLSVSIRRKHPLACCVYTTFQLMLLSSLSPSAISMISSMQTSPDHPTCMCVRMSNVPMDSRKCKNRKASKLRFHHQSGGRSGESEEAMGLSAVMIPLTLVADKRLTFGHLDYWRENNNKNVRMGVNVINITQQFWSMLHSLCAVSMHRRLKV